MRFDRFVSKVVRKQICFLKKLFLRLLENELNVIDFFLKLLENNWDFDSVWHANLIEFPSMWLMWFSNLMIYSYSIGEIEHFVGTRGILEDMASDSAACTGR